VADRVVSVCVTEATGGGPAGRPPGAAAAGGFVAALAGAALLSGVGALTRASSAPQPRTRRSSRPVTPAPRSGS
jgi:hypothetical protein